MKKDIVHLLLLWSVIFITSACATEGVKLEPEDRAMIDTLVKHQLADMAKTMDKWCTDSTPVIRQRLVDSMVLAREQEIKRKMAEMPSKIGLPQ